MAKWHAALAALTMISTTVNAQQNDVLFCVEENSAGLTPSDRYRAARLFNLTRFTARVALNNSSIEINRDGDRRIYACQNFGPVLTCSNATRMFNFNPENRRFTYTTGYGALTSSDLTYGDTITVSFGTCSTF